MKESLTLLGSGAGSLYIALTHHSSSWCPVCQTTSSCVSVAGAVWHAGFDALRWEWDSRGYTYVDGMKWEGRAFALWHVLFTRLLSAESWRAEVYMASVVFLGVAGVVRRGRVETFSLCRFVAVYAAQIWRVSQLLRVFTGSPTGRSSVNFIPWLLS